MNDSNPAITDDKPWGPVHIARWAGMLGFAFPAITLVVYPIWLFPSTQTSGGDVALWAATHHDRLVATMLLNTIGVTLWLLFGAAVWTYLRDQLPARSAVPACFGVGVIAVVLLLLSGFTAFDILLYRHHSAETTTLLYDLTFGLLAMSGMPTVVALGSFAVAVYAHHVLPRYSAYLAFVGAAIHPLLLAAFIVDDGPLSMEGFSITAMPTFLFAWILATAVAMPRKAQQPRPPSSQSTF